jgi:dCTP deaminase
MILADNNILGEMEEGAILVRPFYREKLGTNSYDVHLSPHLRRITGEVLDMRLEPTYEEIHMGEEGYVLEPNELYLGATIEYTESHLHVPILEGKSSCGRLGLNVHICAGFGDVGFCGYWTLELSVVKPLRVYPGVPIAQIAWYLAGTPLTPYSYKASANYANQEAEPQPSKLWRNFDKKRMAWQKQ